MLMCVGMCLPRSAYTVHMHPPNHTCTPTHHIDVLDICTVRRHMCMEIHVHAYMHYMDRNIYILIFGV